MWYSFTTAWYSGDIEEMYQCCVIEGDDKYELGLDSDPSLERTVAIEIDKLFARFDRNASGVIERQELYAMVQDLRQRGYVLESSDDKVVRQILQEFQIGEHDDLVQIEEFRVWFRGVVIMHPANLRSLLFGSAWVQSTIRRLFARADADKSGRVSVKELRVALKGIFRALGNPQPRGDEVIAARVKMMSFDANADKQLSFDEWKQAIVEIMSGLFYAHFKADFEDPLAEHNIRAALRSFQIDRDVSHYNEEFDREHHAVYTLHKKIQHERTSRLENDDTSPAMGG